MVLIQARRMRAGYFRRRYKCWTSCRVGENPAARNYRREAKRGFRPRDCRHFQLGRLPGLSSSKIGRITMEPSATDPNASRIPQNCWRTFSANCAYQGGAAEAAPSGNPAGLFYAPARKCVVASPSTPKAYP
jgi:hypothetical protein